MLSDFPEAEGSKIKRERKILHPERNYFQQTGLFFTLISGNKIV